MNLQDALFDLTEVSKPYWITFNQSKAAKNQINTRLIEMLSLRFSSDSRPVLFLCKKQTDKGVFRPYWLFVCPDEW